MYNRQPTIIRFRVTAPRRSGDELATIAFTATVRIPVRMPSTTALRAMVMGVQP